MKYPSGAIKTKKELSKYIGKHIYHLYGLGQRSSYTKIKLLRIYIDDAYEMYEYKYKPSHPSLRDKINSCLGDVNITENHNNNYLFRNKRLAKKYFKYALINTEDPITRNRRKWREEHYF